jgi:hypothetical protein
VDSNNSDEYAASIPRVEARNTTITKKISQIYPEITRKNKKVKR